MTPQTSPNVTPAPALRRSRRPLWLGVVVAALVGGAAGGWWWLQARRAAPVAVDPPGPKDVTDPDVRQAVEAAQQGVRDRPRSAVAWGNLGLTLLAHQYDADADACFAEAAALAPDDPLWPYARGSVYRKRDLDRSVGFLREAAELAAAGPDGPTYRLTLAEALLERGDTAEAEGIFREELGANPGELRAAFGLGRLLLERGDDALAEAAALLNAAARSPCARKLATGLLAGLERGRGQTARADDLEKKAAEMPDDAPWPDRLLEETLAREVGRWRRVHRLMALERDRRFKEMAEEYEREIADRPTVSAYVNAGFSWVKAGEHGRALPLLRKAVELGPDSPAARYVLARALFGLAEKEGAPASERARSMFREAAEQARRATELKADHARAYLFWGLALKQLGEPAAAVAPLRKAALYEPGAVELQFHLGEALLDAEQYPEARAALEKARRLAPDDPDVAAALERLRKKGG